MPVLSSQITLFGKALAFTQKSVWCQSFIVQMDIGINGRLNLRMP